MPTGLDPLTAVLTDPAAVAIHGIRCNLDAQTGHLAVIGTGMIGLLTALYACQRGWNVAVVHRESRAPSLPQLKAVPEAAFRRPSTVSDGTFDAVIDAATGDNAAALELALRIVRDGGTVVVQNAYYPSVTTKTPLRDIFRRSIRVVGSFSFCRRHQTGDFADALTFLRQYPTRLQHMVTVAGSLAELPAILGDRHDQRQVLIAL